MLVYVLNKDGQPLMPTERCGKVRRLLRDGKAKVVRRCPFTIRLLYETTGHTQPITLGVDAGSRHIGLSAPTEDKVLYEADVEIRNDIVDLLSSRREQRRGRRYRKTRYRAPRFDNRKRPEGWLAPSVQHKVDAHLRVIENVHRMKQIMPAETADRLNSTNLSLIQQIGEHNTFIIENVERLIEARRVANRIKDGRERAIAYHDTVAPLIEQIRYHVDHLELIVDDELWPLPKYREMLFIH